MNRKAEFYRFDKVNTVLKNGTEFNGILRFRKPLKINGKFKGEIESESILYIDSDATVNADIKAKTVIISGTVNGDITAEERIEILAEGKVKGNLKTARLKISDGVKFEGKCSMIRNPESVDVFSARVEKLKEIVQNV